MYRAASELLTNALRIPPLNAGGGILRIVPYFTPAIFLAASR